MFRYSFFLLTFISHMVSASVYPVMVGNEKVLIKVWQGEGKKIFVHLHQNETTALKAAKTVFRQQKAGLLTLQHSGGRNIHFRLNHQRFEFDPNRIFTDKGIKASLKKYSHYTPEAYQEVKKLAEAILKHLPEGRIIAVHNNQGYSIRDYLPGHSLASDAKAVYLSPGHYFRNFYLFTQKKDYLHFKTLGLNGVLQAENASDDGSLSVLFRHKSYINVEAGYNQLSEQIQMLNLA
ncbi:capsule assembly Wzi family protein [Legionella israelensis]|uniref:capsule assembly Wzi family protein n=1 Tax=Legionella israelensis TaxID=454 RepID=UPI001FD2E84C|nr:capsule assembly Wzi family protein [Legionella israelensis]